MTGGGGAVAVSIYVYSFEGKREMHSQASFILKRIARSYKAEVMYNKSRRDSNKIMIVLTATAGLQGTPWQICAHAHLLNAS